MEKFTTVHDALKLASLEVRNKELGPMSVQNFRNHDTKVLKARKICEMHGTTYDAFLRQCTEGLLNDYKS
jgi:hypothetical protein